MPLILLVSVVLTILPTFFAIDIFSQVRCDSKKFLVKKSQNDCQNDLVKTNSELLSSCIKGGSGCLVFKIFINYVFTAGFLISSLLLTDLYFKMYNGKCIKSLNVHSSPRLCTGEKKVTA